MTILVYKTTLVKHRERPEDKMAYAIARHLNKDAVPTAQGALAWSQATVRAADAGRRSLITAIADCAAQT